MTERKPRAMPKITHLEWCRVYANVTRLGLWLIQNCYIETPAELQSYYEKPWKWTDEWDEMQAERTTT